MTPFLVQGSCELSQDYFLTKQVLMNAGDVVRPFARADGTVEALVVADGVLWHLSRSAAETSGWAYAPLPGTGEYPMTDIIDMAVGTGPDGIVRALALRKLNSGYAYAWADLGPSGAWAYPGEMIIAGGLDRLQSGLDPAGNVYFYAFFTSSNNAQLHPNGSFALWQPHLSLLGSFNTSLAGLDITDARLLWNPGWSMSAQGGGVLTVTSKNTAEWHGQESATAFDRRPNSTYGDAKTLLWVSWSAESSDTDPSFAIQGSDGTVSYTDVQADPVRLAVFPAVGADQVATWFKDDLVSFAVLTGGTLNILAQYGNPGINDVQFTPAIPVAGNIVAVAGLPADPHQATLFVTYDDATLHVLTKSPVTDPVTGTLDVWASVPVQQPSPVLQELSTWRVQVSVQDANGTKVPFADVTVTGDREIGVWQASGSTLIGPAAPVTLTTDVRGNITFAVPAVELDTAILTVQALDSAGAPSGAPLTVSPHTDVHQFLAGNVPLAGLGSLTGTAMVTATKPDKSPVFPVLAGLPPASQADGANAMAAAITHMMQAGLGMAPGPDDPKSVLLTMTKTGPTWQTSPDPAAFTMLASSGWWDTAKNEAGSAYHGLRHGVINMWNAGTQWVKKEGEDAYHWVVNLGITIGGDISDIMTIAIDDAKSAIHAVSSFFQAIGADIVTGLDWLEHNVFGLVQAADKNAKVIESLLGQLPAVAIAQLTTWEHLGDSYFTGLKSQAHQALQNVADVAETFAFGTSAPIPPPTKYTGSNDADTALTDIATVLSHVSHNWLLDKIMSWFSGDDDLAVNPAVAAAIQDLITAVVDAADTAGDIGDLIWTGCKDLFADRDAYNIATFGQLLSLFEQVIDDVLSLADTIVDLVLDVLKAVLGALAGMLTHEIEPIPLLSGLLKLCGIDTSMTVGHLVALILAYPIALYSDIRYKGAPLFPAVTGAPGAGAADSGDDWFFGLNLAAAFTQGLWGGADFFEDLYKPEATDVPSILSWVDIIAPLILACLQWPGATRTDGTTPPPFSTQFPDSKDGEMLGPIWVLGLVPPAAGIGVKMLLPDPDPKSWPQYVAPTVTMVSAIGGLVVGSIYNFGTGADKLLKATTIFGNLSNILALCSTKAMAEETEDVSLAIKLMIDVIGNLGAAICMMQYASEHMPSDDSAHDPMR